MSVTLPLVRCRRSFCGAASARTYSRVFVLFFGTCLMLCWICSQAEMPMRAVFG